MRSIGHPDSKMWPKQCTNVGLKTLGWTMFGVGPDKGRLEVSVSPENVPWDRIMFDGAGQSPVGSLCFARNSPLSSQTWFLSYTPPNRMKRIHKGHLNTRNKFPKEVFPKSNYFPSNFGWTQKPMFSGNEEKSMKSKELETWIHSKVGGRWWGLS